MKDKKRSEQVGVDEELSGSEERFRVLADTAPAMLWVTEPDGFCSFLSHEWYEFTGQTEQEGLGQGGFGRLNAVHSDDRERAGRMFQDANKTHRPFSLKYRLRRHDGEYRWAIDAGHPRFGPNGEFLGYIGSVLDINDRKETEQEKNLLIEDLNRSKQYFRALFDWTPSAVGISTVAEGRLCDVNEGFSRLTGYTREELIGRTTLELGLWADPSQREIVLREIREQGFVHNREGLLRTKSGEIRSLMVTVESIQLGPTPCLIYLAHDITERKRAEQQLRRSEQELADFFENATVGLHWVGPDGIILRANRAELNLLGYAADEYLGHHIAEFHTDQGVIGDILRRLTAGEELHDYEARLRCKDGSVRHVLISSNVLWEEGRFVHTRCFTSDITERKQAEEALRTSEERLRKIFECSNDAIFVVDPERDLICQANPKACEMFGYGPDEILATPISRFHSRDLAEFQKFFQRVFEEGRGWTNEFPCRTKDGRFVTSEISASTLLVDGRACILTIVRDITERKQAEALLAAEKKVFGLIATGAVMPDVLDTLMREIEAQSTDGMLCSVLLADETGQRLLHGAAPSLPDAYNAAVHGFVIGPSAGSCGTAAFERKPVFVTDIAADPRWAIAKDLAAAHGLGACHSTPILSSKGRLLGTIAMYYRRPHNPGTHDRQLIERATQLAGIAIERRQAEETLRLAKFSVDRAADAVYWIDSQAKVLDVNEAASRMLGYSKDELCAMTVHDLNPDFQADMWPGFWAETRNSGPLVFESFHKAKNDLLIPIEVSVNFLSYEGKEYHCAFVRDITERKQVEAALEASKARFRAIFDQTFQFIGLMKTDGTLIEANRSALQFAGIREEDVLGKLFWDTPWWTHSPELQNRLREAVRQASSGTMVRFEATHLSSIGELTHVDFSLKPVRDEHGKVTLLIPEGHNITERIRVEVALRESEDRYRSIFEKAVEGIFQTTPDGKYVAVNPALARIYGYDSPADLIATITDIAGQLYVDPERRDEFLRLMQAQKEVTGFEALVYRKDGSFMWISESARTLRDQAGTVVGYEGTVEDITERKRAEGRLRSTLDQVRTLSGKLATVQEEERTRIARELHDELGVKLTCLKIDLSRLRSIVGNRVRPALRGQLNDRIGSVIEQVDGTIAAVQRLVTQLRPALLDNLGLVAAIEWQSQDFQKRTGIPCTCVTNADDIAMEPERATAALRICQEALTNTARHAQATAVTITVTSQPDSLQMTVTDNGVGIPDIKTSDRRSFGLLGMQERAAHCGGTVTIESDPDKGTTVTLCLPVGGGSLNHGGLHVESSGGR